MKTLLTILPLLFALCGTGLSQSTNTLRTGTHVIWVIVSTNSVEIGTLTTTGGAERFRVFDESWITNTVAVLEFENTSHKVILKSERGPRIGERRERKEAIFQPDHSLLIITPTNVGIGMPKRKAPPLPPIPGTGNKGDLNDRMLNLQLLHLP